MQPSVNTSSVPDNFERNDTKFDSDVLFEEILKTKNDEDTGNFVEADVKISEQARPNSCTFLFPLEVEKHSHEGYSMHACVQICPETTDYK